MDKVKQNLGAAQVFPNVTTMIHEWNHGADVGQSSGVRAMDGVFKRKKGFINGWYGWANDGKGTMWDYLSIVGAMQNDDFKYIVFKPEDMSAHKYNGNVEVDANDIFNNLIWTFTGITPYKHFSKAYNVPQLDKKTYLDALDWVQDRFIVIYPKDRHYKNIIDHFKFYQDKYKAVGMLIDPHRSVKFDAGVPMDQMLNDYFFQLKEMALQTDTFIDLIAHPKAQSDVKVSNKEDAAYKVVTQWMVAGGAAWDNAMDSQYSTFRPERHLDPKDPKVHFYNLKQRKAELTMAYRGVCKNIIFDFLSKRYYFNDICPITSRSRPGTNAVPPSENLFEQTKAKGTDDLPF